MLVNLFDIWTMSIHQISWIKREVCYHWTLTFEWKQILVNLFDIYLICWATRWVKGSKALLIDKVNWHCCTSNGYLANSMFEFPDLSFNWKYFWNFVNGQQRDSSTQIYSDCFRFIIFFMLNRILSVFCEFTLLHIWGIPSNNWISEIATWLLWILFINIKKMWLIMVNLIINNGKSYN